MSEEVIENYNSGEIVWVKLGSSWWPGEVKNLSDLENEDMDFKKPPLVIVKFFEEDSYEYVKSWANIFPYGCEKKNDFIKKGMAAFRAKIPHMEKFPKDVLTAESKMGGNPNILSDPMFLPEKKRNYAAEIFGTPSPKNKSYKDKRRSNINKSSNSKDAPHITHRRFLGMDDYKAYICIQYPGKDRTLGDAEDDEVIRINKDPEEEFNCNSCSFTTKRLEVMLLHTKAHIRGLYISTPIKSKVVRKYRKGNKSKSSKDITESESSSSDELHRERKRKQKTQGNKKAKIKKVEPEPPKKARDIADELLAVWDDTDEEEEDLTPQKSTIGENTTQESLNNFSSDAIKSQLSDDTVNQTTDILKSDLVRKSLSNLINEVNPNHTEVLAEPLTDVGSKSVEIMDVGTSQDAQALIKTLEADESTALEPENQLLAQGRISTPSHKEIQSDNKTDVSADVIETTLRQFEENTEFEDSAVEDKAKQKMDKDIQEAIKSCFDFDEDDEDDHAIVSKAVAGRKIPRVIPRKKCKETSPFEGSFNKDKILQESAGYNKRDEVENKTEEVDAAFKELMEMTSVPELPEIHNNLKCEQNFHCIKTIKFPDKSDTVGSPPGASKTEKKETTEVATKLTNPKKRFVKSFEDFELMQNEIRRKEEQTKEDELPKIENHDVKPVEDMKEDISSYSLVNKLDTDSFNEDSIMELSSLKTKIMSRIIEEANLNEEPKARIMSKMQEPKITEKVLNINEEIKIEKSRTPRSKILELYRNDTNKYKGEDKRIAEEVKNTVTMNIAEEVICPQEIETRKDVVPPKKGKWSRRGSHPKKDRSLFLSESSLVQNTVSDSSKTEEQLMQKPILSESCNSSLMEECNSRSQSQALSETCSSEIQSQPSTEISDLQIENPVIEETTNLQSDSKIIVETCSYQIQSSEGLSETSNMLNNSFSTLEEEFRPVVANIEAVTDNITTQNEDVVDYLPKKGNVDGILNKNDVLTERKILDATNEYIEYNIVKEEIDNITKEKTDLTIYENKETHPQSLEESTQMVVDMGNIVEASKEQETEELPSAEEKVISNENLVDEDIRETCSTDIRQKRVVDAQTMTVCLCEHAAETVPVPVENLPPHNDDFPMVEQELTCAKDLQLTEKELVSINQNLVEKDLQLDEHNILPVEQENNTHNSPSIKQDMPLVEPNLPQVEQDLSLEQDLPNVEQDSSPIEQNLLHVEHDLPKIEQDLSCIAQDLSPIELDLSKMEQDLSSSEQGVSQVEQDLSPIEQDFLHLRQDLSPFEKNLHHMEQDLSQVKQDLSPIEEDLPMTKKDLCSVEEGSPLVEKDMVPIEQDTPSDNQGIVATEQGFSPTQKDELPPMEQDLPVIEQELSLVDHNLPSEQTSEKKEEILGNQEVKELDAIKTADCSQHEENVEELLPVDHLMDTRYESTVATEVSSIEAKANIGEPVVIDEKIEEAVKENSTLLLSPIDISTVEDANIERVEETIREESSISSSFPVAGATLNFMQTENILSFPPKKSKKRKISECDDPPVVKTDIPEPEPEHFSPMEKRKKDEAIVDAITDRVGQGDSIIEAEEPEVDVEDIEEPKDDVTKKTEEIMNVVAEQAAKSADMNNKLEIYCASNSPQDSFKFSIQTNLSNLSSKEEMSALALATLSELKSEDNKDVPVPEHTKIVLPAPNNSELVQVEGNLTVVSEKDLADGQVEITSNRVITPKKPVTLTNFSMDFSDSNDDSNSTNDAMSDKSTDFISKGTEFTSKAMTKEIKRIDTKKENTYERLELLDILEGNSDTEKKSKEYTLAPKVPIGGDEICDFEEHIPSQIVCAKSLNKDNIMDEIFEKEIEKEKRKEKKVQDRSITSRLMERLTEAKKPKITYGEGKSSETVSRVAKKNQITGITGRGSKYTAKLKPQAGSNKPIILSEQIIKPALDSTKKTKKTFNDIEDVEAFVIHKDLKKMKMDEEDDSKKLAKSAGKAKILQQTIITAAGEIIQPQVNQSQTDDNIFDINSMPIVLSDEILTPESIENMPIVIDETKTVGEKLITLPKKQSQGRILGKIVTTALTSTTVSPTITNKTPTILKQSKTSRIVQTLCSKIVKNSPLLPNTAKPGKYIIVPQSGLSQTKYVGKKAPILKRTVVSTGLIPKVPNITPEPSGNKIMIVTNQQGQQQRLLLTPAQQKILGYQNQKVNKTVMKSNVLQKSILATKPLTEASTSGIVPKPSTFVPGQKIVVNSNLGLMTPVNQVVTSARNVKGITKRLPINQKNTPNKPQKTILIKNQHGQTVRKIQGTDDELLDKQVAEQLEAIKASSGMKFQSPPKHQTFKTSPKVAIRRSYAKKVDTKLKSTPPPLTSIQPVTRIETTTSVAFSKKPESVEVKPTHSPMVIEENKVPDRPLNQLVIQDAVGNQTTITEGQILALPSETVDGQPQSYMLVTLDESGNLTPLNNEALMSLDPNLGLGGDLSNMVLQIDPGGLSERPQIATIKVNEPAKITEKIESAPAILVPEPSIMTEVADTTLEKMQPPQTIAGSTNGDAGQQLIVTGDPIATQKFLESLTEGTTDLANILANAEGNSILIQADGQQILINTNSDNQMLLSMNNDANVNESTEGGGNPIFATQPNKNQDILAAALADTDVFQQDQHTSQGKITSQLSPNNVLYPMNVGNVLETSLTLSSPIMTPLEVPSTNNKKIADNETDILTQVPKNIDLPITITDPNISQTVANQQVASLIATELRNNLKLGLPISETNISAVSTEINSPSYVYSLPTLEDSVDIAQKPFNSSMPLLDEESTSKTPHDKSDEPSRKSINSDGCFLEEEEEGRFTLGGEMCSSLSEPPPEMFDIPEVNSDFMEKRVVSTPSSLQSTPEGKDDDSISISIQTECSSEGSCEIPLQPQIITKSLDLDVLK